MTALAMIIGMVHHGYRSGEGGEQNAAARSRGDRWLVFATFATLFSCRVFFPSFTGPGAPQAARRNPEPVVS